jgi:hypothetical protein
MKWARFAFTTLFFGFFVISNFNKHFKGPNYGPIEWFIPAFFVIKAVAFLNTFAILGEER